ncbi:MULTISPECIES: quinone-dependent dihydroorotate dehydrogenase [unclassified Paenibacillus]|uniref:quinone-dependent dihydroorotate dehydrogenase n=1 Tax=unclassified Paenibacillus TaxID=185978 RepID=UPI001AEA5EAB|nr:MULTISPECIES: quinone-dependent dihydroorotate dehydrogenase [unclassified Paenibacillus]MBP1154790.1 dihydroorotate dehydrogenase [Paenibacillus sp. PvP091]MBP1169826.1 dihydroorotate dehydrogenase [Paenibacillus sp. PvR098]MBP2440854.1 dihydroorotate dehydrogenase [Paenibacillus sp. PvP052]
MLYKKIAKPVLFGMDPEKAHHMIIDGMHTAGKLPGGRMLLRSVWGVRPVPELEMQLWGITFNNPVGLAAGLDKNAKAVPGFSNIGFGFMEVGTVTPKPQAGNELPRLFRLPEDDALINRMGFNNVGIEGMKRNLRDQGKRTIPLAINIGKNKSTPNEQAEEDYRACIQSLYGYGDFFVVNISSPNTPDLRDLQHGDDLSRLLAAVKDEVRKQHARFGGREKPVLVKIAPDLQPQEVEYTVDTIMRSNVSGIIASNTTVSRDGLRNANRNETGGLSGRPLTERSTELIRAIYKATGGQLPIIGSGGIFSAEDAYEKIRAGASLVEVYTALIYEGPALIGRINDGLRALLRKDGFKHVSEAIGSAHRG